MMKEIRAEDGRSPWAVCGLLCLAYVLLFCWLGRYACPAADDYWGAMSLRAYGFWGTQRAMYLGILSRAGATFLASLLHLLPMEACYGLFPALTLLTYALSMGFLAATLLPAAARRVKAALTLLLTSVTLAVLPALNETLYWLSGMFYFWATSFLLLGLALGIRALRGSWLCFWLALPVLLFGGVILEMSCVLQGVVAFVAMIALWFTGGGRMNRRALMAGAFWLVSVAAFLVMYLAPATANRMGAIATAPFVPHFLKMLMASGLFGAFTCVKFFVKPMAYVLLLFLPEVAGAMPSLGEGRARLRAWHIVALTALTAFLMQAIAGWALGSGLALRAESLTVWMMGALWAGLWAFGYRNAAALARIRASRLHAWRWGLLALCLVLNSNFLDLVRDLRTGPVYRAEFDERERIIAERREAGEREAVVPLRTVRPGLLFVYDLILLSDMRLGPQDGAYWGLDRVIALPRPLWERFPTPQALEGVDLAAEVLREAETDAYTQTLVGKAHDPIYPGLEGLPKDSAKAAEWYLRAISNGYDYVYPQRSVARLIQAVDPSLRGRLRSLYWLARSQLLTLRI